MYVRLKSDVAWSGNELMMVISVTHHEEEQTVLVFDPSDNTQKEYDAEDLEWV